MMAALKTFSFYRHTIVGAKMRKVKKIIILTPYYLKIHTQMKEWGEKSRILHQKRYAGRVQ